MTVLYQIKAHIWYKTDNLSFLSKNAPQFDTKQLKKVLFQGFSPCFYQFYLLNHIVFIIWNLIYRTVIDAR